MPIHRTIWALVLSICLLSSTWAADNDVPRGNIGGLHLSEAVICESLDNFKPLNPSAVFSVRLGSVMCFTAFDRVPTETSIFHDWIRQDKLIFRKKLVLKPPSWSSVSSIQLREADKGPWRVEIRDIDGNLLRTLRFSITD
jgi:hypothetical protein